MHKRERKSHRQFYMYTQARKPQKHGGQDRLHVRTGGKRICAITFTVTKSHLPLIPPTTPSPNILRLKFWHPHVGVGTVALAIRGVEHVFKATDATELMVVLPW